jgi:hypothetical protein
LWRCGDGLFFEVPPLASDALLTMLYPLLGNVLQTVDHFENSCLGAPFSWLEKQKNRSGRDLDYMADVIMGSTNPLFPSRTQNSIQISPHVISGLFQPRKGSSEARNFKVINGLQHVFEKWVERCKKCIACQGRYFEKKRPSPHLHKVPTRINKASPRTLQTPAHTRVKRLLHVCNKNQCSIQQSSTCTYIMRSELAFQKLNQMLILLQSKGTPKFHINTESLGYFYCNVKLCVGYSRNI